MYLSELSTARSRSLLKICDAGDSANHNDFNPGATVEDTSYIVYLVTRKDDDSKCIICPNAYISDLMERKTHFETVHWKEVVLFNRALEKLKGREEKDNREIMARIEKILEWTQCKEGRKEEFK
ncbi:hypothetical protein PVAND_010908 [Polypedilum vanderplanki]|uniref:Uncharacterized protein n=1 Tax=Polypedilum vanderplanki TaxID=319348 RepID=A0A9J6CHF2_POLVA|nr:hypothetical protein PVAND_010908 [Polypedilum vanderplanki]